MSASTAGEDDIGKTNVGMIKHLGVGEEGRGIQVDVLSSVQT